MIRPGSLDEIESLAIGAWILGTGGGGSPYLALLNLRKLYGEGKVVSLMHPADLAADDWMAVVSNMGAPLVGHERLTDPTTIAQAVTMMEEVIGRRFGAIMSLEIGGGNALQPFMAAALLDRPVVDGDCMGRAFPEAQMTSFAIHDLRMYPLTLVNVRNNAVIVARAESWKWMERLSRTACVAVGSFQNEFAVGWLDGLPCDKQVPREDPRARRAMTEKGVYVICGLIAVAGCASKLSVFDASKTPRRSEVFGFTRESQTF